MQTMQPIDLLNGNLSRIYADEPGQYLGRALMALEPGRLAIGYEPRHEVLPERETATVAPYGAVTSKVSVPAGSYLWAMAATSEQVDGFTVQITDVSTRRQMFSQSINWRNLSGQSYPAGVKDCYGAAVQIKTPLCILPKPRLVGGIGQLAVELINLAAAANRVQLVMFFAVPPGVGQVTNLFNELIAGEAMLQELVKASPSSQSKQLFHRSIDISAAGDNVIIAAAAGQRIAIYEMNLWNPVQKTITLKDGQNDQLQGPLTDFAAGAGWFLPYTQVPHFEATHGSFIIHLSNATPLSGFVRYRLD